ncbi:MAG: nucleotidyltransferase domain-containing protein [Nanoarchaeota archaeon]|nr:nucleotidyltransferase domain-containing protein [Nanoarchaeota archaeon]
MEKKLAKMKRIELNEASYKIQRWFFSYPDKEFGLNNLAEALKISKTTANRTIHHLVDEGFLNLEIIGKLWRITCNQNHIYNYSRKISYNLSMIYESIILKAIHEIIPNPMAIILFGSYRKGDDNENSDIDIAVEVLGNKGLRIENLGIFPEFGFRKNVQVTLHIFSRKKIDLNLFANIANGIVLEGLLEIKP